MSPCASYSLICHSAVLILKRKCDHVTSKTEILKLPSTTLRILFLTVQFYLSRSHTHPAIRNCSQVHQFCHALLCALSYMLFRDNGLSFINLLQFQLLWETPFYPHHSQTTLKYLFNLFSEYPVVTSIIAYNIYHIELQFCVSFYFFPSDQRLLWE